MTLAREYRRLSDKKGGTSLDDQGTDNGTAAEDQGFELGLPYIDDGKSASRYARGRRDDFEQLVDDLNSGPTGRTSRFGADVLMLWESSRGSRRVGEWVSFIELCEDKGVRIWVTTHERLYDPANGRDRKALIDDANDSEFESYKTHRRVTRTTPKEAAKGRPHGQAPYGLKPLYDPGTGRLVTWVEDEARSMVPRELFRLLEAGHTFNEIERRFARRGYTHRSDRPFTHGHLRRMAIMHSYAGLRSYNGTVYPGVWDGLVSEERFWAVYRLITDPSRNTRKKRGGRTHHVLTAVLHCGRCNRPGHLLAGVRTPSDRKPTYNCKRCGLKIQKIPVDDLLIGERHRPGVLMRYLARADIYDVLRTPGSDQATVLALQAVLARARAERDELRGAKGKTLAEVRILAASLDAKEEEVTALEAREHELTVPAPVLELLRPGLDVWDTWHAAPIEARRATARLICSPPYLGRPVVSPSPRPGWHQPITERISWQTSLPTSVR